MRKLKLLIGWAILLTTSVDALADPDWMYDGRMVEFGKSCASSINPTCVAITTSTFASVYQFEKLNRGCGVDRCRKTASPRLFEGSGATCGSTTSPR